MPDQDERTVNVVAEDPEPGQLAGEARYIHCEFCGFKGAPLTALSALEAELAKHGKGICGA